MELNELKAKAYDLICKHESLMFEASKIKQSLDKVNSEIYKLVKVSEEKDEEHTS